MSNERRRDDLTDILRVSFGHSSDCDPKEIEVFLLKQAFQIENLFAFYERLAILENFLGGKTADDGLTQAETEKAEGLSEGIPG